MSIAGLKNELGILGYVNSSWYYSEAHGIYVLASWFVYLVGSDDLGRVPMIHTVVAVQP